MTWFSRAAPRAADPRWGGGGGLATQRREEVARAVPTARARGSSPATADGGTRPKAFRAAALKVRAEPHGRRASERSRVEQGPNWSEELNTELWRQPWSSESTTTTRFVNKRVETVPNHSAQKPGKLTNGGEEYVRNERPPTSGLGVNLQPIRV